MDTLPSFDVAVPETVNEAVDNGLHPVIVFIFWYITHYIPFSVSFHLYALVCPSNGFGIEPNSDKMP